MNQAGEAKVASKTPLMYNAAIGACAHSEEARRAEFWLHKMEEAAVAEPRLAPDVVSNSNVMNACAQMGQADHAELWLWPSFALDGTPEWASRLTLDESLR
jgi:hypothetical protein